MFIKNFIDSCINFNNIKILVIIMLLTFWCTNNIYKTFISGIIYIVSLIIVWRLVIRYKDGKRG